MEEQQSVKLTDMKNVIHIEFKETDSIAMKVFYVSDDVSPLQIFAITKYLQTMAEHLLIESTRKQAIIEADKKILKPVH